MKETLIFNLKSKKINKVTTQEESQKKDIIHMNVFFF